MNGDLIKFCFEGNSFRTMNQDGNVFFCLPDLCRILGIDNVSQVKSRLRRDGVIMSKGVVKTGRRADGSVYEQEGSLTFINEPNFYRTILQSRMPIAEPFTDYVCMEVLPSIRKTGGYIVEKEGESDTDLLARALLVAQEQIRRREIRANELEEELRKQEVRTNELEKKIRDSKPALNYANNVLKSVDTYTTSFIAKELGFKNAKELNITLKNAGVIYRQSDKWMLKAGFCGKYYTKTKTYPYMDGMTGEQRTNVYMVWTEKGRRFLHEFFGKTVNVPAGE